MVAMAQPPSSSSTTTSGQSEGGQGKGGQGGSGDAVAPPPGDLWALSHPNALEQLDEVVRRAGLGRRRIGVFLDYDGTLAHIVRNPEEAWMASGMREAVSAISELFPTAIISGRARRKVQHFVDLPGLTYAGSHGMDIKGPESADISVSPPEHVRSTISELEAQLRRSVDAIPGAQVENNTYCLSCHYRNVEKEQWSLIFAAIDDVVRQSAHDLVVTQGRKVLEIRPALDWNKGTALAYLTRRLSQDSRRSGSKPGGDSSSSMSRMQEEMDDDIIEDDYDRLVPIYLGDDRSDEDAFEELARRGPGGGVGILVSSKPKETAASFHLTGPDQVREFLLALATEARRVGGRGGSNK